MRVTDVMSPYVLSVGPEQTVREVAALFVANKISGAPVLDAAGEIVGIISEGDLIRRVELDTDSPRRRSWLDFFSATDDAADYVKTHAVKVKDVMTKNVTTVDEETSLAELANLLESKRIKRVPVTRAGKLIGIVSRSNLVQALASMPARDEHLSSTEDRDIRAILLGEIADRNWNLSGRNIVVTDGVVHLWGLFDSMEQVDAVRVAAENIHGVKRIEDHTQMLTVLPFI